MEIAIDKDTLLAILLHGKENKICPEKLKCKWNAVGMGHWRSVQQGEIGARMNMGWKNMDWIKKYNKWPEQKQDIEVLWLERENKWRLNHRMERVKDREFWEERKEQQSCGCMQWIQKMFKEEGEKNNV